MIYTPEMLAARWGISQQTVYNEISRGNLRCFRAGRNIRIPASAVEEYEACTTSGSATTAADGTPSGPRTEPPGAFRSAPMTASLPRPASPPFDIRQLGKDVRQIPRSK